MLSENKTIVKLQFYLYALLAAFIFNMSSGLGQSPVITSFTPGVGPVGSIVAISGSNLSNPSSVTVGGTSAIIVSSSASQVVAMVMPGTSSGTIAVTTAGGTTTSSGSFTVNTSQAPAIQQGSKLNGTGSIGTSVYQGWATAISADGNTAIVGGPYDDGGAGAAWVFTRTGSTWSQQGIKIAGSDSTGDPYQGWSVALSADGNTALIGGPFNEGGLGAAWVFTRSGSTWTQQGTKLVGTGSVGTTVYMGYSVALSADGNTAIVGGPYDNSFEGAIWIFKRNGSTWTQQGSKLTASDDVGVASLGWSVALSANGRTALAGGYYDNSNIGAAWVFTSNGTTWSQQGNKLVGTGSVGSTVFQGYSVALSADGNTALSGGPNDNNGLGAAWVFTRSGSTWSQQGSKLTGSGSSGSNVSFGNAVALNANGNIAMSGGNYDNNNIGATWVFTRSGSTWTQKGSKLVGSGYTGFPQQGYSLAISANGNNAIIGGYSDNSFKGAAWIYVPASVNANLSNLTISSGTLSPVFNTAINSYSASVANGTTSLTVTPTAEDPNATIQVRINNGTYNNVNSGNPSGSLSLNVGSNTIDVLVTAQDGTSTSLYTITVTRACSGMSATLSGSASVCPGSGTNLVVNITGGTGPYTVIYSGGTINNYTSGSNIPVNPSSNTTYTLSSVTDANGCPSGVSGSATVNVKENAGIGSVSATNNPVCPGGSTTLTANGVTGTNAVVTFWTGPGGTGTNLGTGTTLTNATAQTYYARVTGDCGSPAEVSITVTEYIVPVIANHVTSSCSGTAFLVSPSGVPGGTTYSWNSPSYSGAVSGGSAQSGQATISQNLINNSGAPGTATYTVTPYAGSCSGNSFTVTVTVNPLPVPTFTSAPLSPVCIGENVTYTTQSGKDNYSWSIPGVAGTDYTITAGGSGSSSNTVTLHWMSAGTKTVTVNYSSNNCEGSSPASSSLTVNSAANPSVGLALSSGTNPTCANSNVTFMATPLNAGPNPSYQWYNNNSPVPGVTGPTYTITGLSVSNPPNVFVVMTVTPGFCAGSPTATSSSFAITVVNNSWTGSYSNQWGDGRNWCANSVPVAGSNVFIPVTSQNPVISSNSAVNNIHIDAGAKVTMNNCTLTVNGTLNGTGLFAGTRNAGLTLTGTGNLGLLYTDTAGIGSLTISSTGATLTAGNAFNVVSGLNIGSSTFNTNNQVTIKSSVDGTGWVGPITSGSIVGNVTVERYIPKNAFRSWRLLSVPVTGSGTFKSAWQENQPPMVNGVPGYGTLLTSMTGGNGYDAQTSGNSLLQWNGSAWVAVSSTGNAMNTNQGYFVYIRGDRSANIQPGNYDPGSTTLRTSGTLYQGTQPVINVGAGQNVLIGNVYVCAIDFANLTRSGVNAFKVWDPKLQGSAGLGGYQTFSAINGFDPIPGGGSYGSAANSRIENGQAFFVSSNTGGFVQLTENAKVTGSRNVFRGSGNVSRINVKLFGEGSREPSLLDGAAVIFDESAENGVDNEDVIKMNNPGENISIHNNGNNLVLEARKNILPDDQIDLKLINLKQQSYILEVDAQNIGSSVSAWMEDKFTGTKTPLDLVNTTKIVFTVTEEIASATADRFRILFKNPLPVTITSPEVKGEFLISPNPVTNNQFRVQFINKESGRYTLRIMSATGQVIHNEIITHAGGNSFYIPRLKGAHSGIYRIEIGKPGKESSVQSIVITK